MVCRNGKVKTIGYTEEKKSSVVYESDQMIIFVIIYVLHWYLFSLFHYV